MRRAGLAIEVRFGRVVLLAKPREITNAASITVAALFDFAVTYQGKYSDSIASVQPFYNSWSGFQDELAYGGLWLARGLEAAGQDGTARHWKKEQTVWTND